MDKQKLKEAGLKRFAALRANSVNVEDRTAEFIISTEAVDSYNTVFKADGWDFTRYEKNPIVFYQHDTHSKDPDVAIGTSEVRTENGEIIGVVTFEDADLNPLADKVMRKIAAGTLRGASINADIEDGRFGNEDLNEDPNVLYFTRQSLMEWSVVTVPSNPEALARCKKSITELRVSEKPADTVEDEPKKMSRYAAQIINNKNL